MNLTNEADLAVMIINELQGQLQAKMRQLKVVFGEDDIFWTATSSLNNGIIKVDYKHEDNKDIYLKASFKPVSNGITVNLIVAVNKEGVVECYVDGMDLCYRNFRDHISIGDTDEDIINYYYSIRKPSNIVEYCKFIVDEWRSCCYGQLLADATKKERQLELSDKLNKNNGCIDGVIDNITQDANILIRRIGYLSHTSFKSKSEKRTTDNNTADCGECKYCKDMVKFGGEGGLKQKCVLKLKKWLYKKRVLEKDNNKTPVVVKRIKRTRKQIESDNKQRQLQKQAKIMEKYTNIDVENNLNDTILSLTSPPPPPSLTDDLLEYPINVPIINELSVNSTINDPRKIYKFNINDDVYINRPSTQFHNVCVKVVGITPTGYDVRVGDNEKNIPSHFLSPIELLN